MDQVAKTVAGLTRREVMTLDGQAEDVFEGEVALLDVHGDRRRDDDVVMAEIAHLATAVAGKANGGAVHLARL